MEIIGLRIWSFQLISVQLQSDVYEQLKSVDELQLRSVYEQLKSVNELQLRSVYEQMRYMDEIGSLQLKSILYNIPNTHSLLT